MVELPVVKPYVVSMDVDRVLAKVGDVMDADNVEQKRRFVYLGELFDWSDYYSERYVLTGDVDSEEAVDARIKICSLLIKYSEYEETLENFDDAFSVYMDAMQEGIVSRVYELYEKCAECYHRLREKLTIEKKEGDVSENGIEDEGVLRGIYIKGLTGLLSKEDTQKLWTHYLSLYNKDIKKKKDQIKMVDLYWEVRKIDGTILPPKEIMSKDASSSKKGKRKLEGDAEDEDEYLFGATDGGEYKQAQDAASDQFKRAEALQLQQQSERVRRAVQSNMLNDLDTVQGFTPEVLIRKYHITPPLVFESIYNKTEYAKSTLVANVDVIQTLSNYLQCSLKDDGSLNNETNDWICDILESMWISQALKEKQYHTWFTDLLQLHHKENDSTKIVTTEQSKMDTRHLVQREVLNAIVNKSLCALMIEQQQLLCKIQFPGFTQKVIDMLESNFVKMNVSADAASGTAKWDEDLLESLALQRQYVYALLQGRLVGHQWRESRFSAKEEEVSTLTTESTDHNGDKEGMDTVAVEDVSGIVVKEEEEEKEVDPRKRKGRQAKK